MTRLSVVILGVGLGACAAAAEMTTASPAHPAPAKPGEQLAGYIFGVPVPASNYYFAKQVAYMFQRPGEEQLSTAERERVIWEALILHYECFRRGLTVSKDELNQRINEVLGQHQQAFTRDGDPQAYAAWVSSVTKESVELFEHQMEFMLLVDRLKDQVRESRPVTVSEDEMRQEFLNEHHHVGGEYVLFDTNEAAQAFYEEVKAPGAWEQHKSTHPEFARPFSLITLEAIIDLWSVPKEQIYAFHALEPGTVGPPMPFGNQWGVFRLLDKRTGDLKDFPAQRDAYYQQLKVRKQYEELKQWIEDLKVSANLQVLPLAASWKDAPTIGDSH